MVASFYPLAWAAERVGGPGLEVVDLTPPGGEAHEASLTARQRADIEEADLVLLLSVSGFQPEIERAAEDAGDRVVEVPPNGGGLFHPGEGDLSADPHVWLDPVIMQDIVRAVADALADRDPAGAVGYRRRAREVVDELERLDRQYAMSLEGCTYNTLVVTHEAFGYLAGRYGLAEVGVAGLSPEAEPSADRLNAVADVIELGRAGAVFYERTDEGERLGRSVAEDNGVPALPLYTLESDPEEGDYLSAMEENLSALSEGLGCS